MIHVIIRRLCPHICCIKIVSSILIGYFILVHIVNDIFKVFRCKQEIRGSLNKFPDFFRIATFIDNTHMKL